MFDFLKRDEEREQDEDKKDIPTSTAQWADPEAKKVKDSVLKNVRSRRDQLTIAQRC